MSYINKLRDPRWQKLRLEIMNRDGFKCRICSDEKTELQVHHAYYQKGLEPWESDTEILFTLCDPCHDRCEKNKKILALLACDRPAGLIALERVAYFLSLTRGHGLHSILTSLMDKPKILGCFINLAAQIDADLPPQDPAESWADYFKEFDQQ